MLTGREVAEHEARERSLPNLMMKSPTTSARTIAPEWQVPKSDFKDPKRVIRM